MDMQRGWEESMDCNQNFECHITRMERKLYMH